MSEFVENLFYSPFFNISFIQFFSPCYRTRTLKILIWTVNVELNHRYARITCLVIINCYHYCVNCKWNSHVNPIFSYLRQHSSKGFTFPNFVIWFRIFKKFNSESYHRTRLLCKIYLFFCTYVRCESRNNYVTHSQEEKRNVDLRLYRCRCSFRLSQTCQDLLGNAAQVGVFLF